MSKIVSPYPAFTGDAEPPAHASWWRFRLVRNSDGNVMLMETDGTGLAEATWCSWEFFDGHDTIIDAGFDRPTWVRVTYLDVGGHVDVLHDGPPTPSPRWRQLTKQGDPTHPDDRFSAGLPARRNDGRSR